MKVLKEMNEMEDIGQNVDDLASQLPVEYVPSTQ